MKKISTRDRVIKQRIQLLMKHPFFGIPLMRLRLKEDLTCSTAWVDGISLGYNPAYVEGLTDNLLRGLLVHEVLHVCNLHMLRRGLRDPKLWNQAADAAIDWIAADAAIDVPDSFTHNPQWNWARGLSAEVIYDRLQQEGGGKDGDQPRPGEVRDAPCQTEAEKTLLGQQVKMMLNQAKLAAELKNRGSVPAWMKILLDNVLKPKVRWQEVLEDFVRAVHPTDYSWRKPNRRFLWNRTYLPAVTHDGMGPLLIYADSSGSTMNDWGQFFSEMNYIVDVIKPSTTYVAICDADLRKISEYSPGDKISSEWMGGGGSDFRPAFAKVEELGITPDVAVVLSDMDIAFPDAAPDYPVLGITTTKKEGPSWMKTIPMHP
ncbi:MAG TPA: VWA-like domain-containing protein [Rhodopila sp.]|nr:VWA-like domain-containing protein [Rhodopila sp.]